MLDGTNHWWSVINIYTVHLYQTTDLLNVPCNQHGKLLDRKWRSTFFLQWNMSLGEMLDQVHFSCKKICWKVAKYDLNIFSLTVSLYELFEWPSYMAELWQFNAESNQPGSMSAVFCCSPPGTRTDWAWEWACWGEDRLTGCDIRVLLVKSGDCRPATWPPMRTIS